MARRKKLSSDERFARMHVGPEPSFPEGHTLDNTELSTALNWYNYMYGGEYDRAIKFLTTLYDKIDKGVSERIRNIIKPYRVQTYGWVARLLSNGYKVEQGVLVRMKEALRQAILESVKPETHPTAPRVSKAPQDLLDSKLADLISEVDDLVFDDQPVSIYDMLTAAAIPPQSTGRIKEFFEPIANEFRGALAGKDKDLKEAYRTWTKARLKARVDVFDTMFADIERYSSNRKVARKPRKKRVISMDKKLKAFHYLAKDDALKLVSVSPATIVGATILYTFDTKSKKLTRLNAEQGQVLDIKGSSLLNVDLAASTSKRCGRKQATVLEQVLTTTKARLTKVFDGINSAALTPTARINSNTILLRVVKP